MLSVTIILAFIFLVTGILLLFYLKNKQLKSIQEEYVIQLKIRIEENQNQINIRKRNLAAYNFLKYNLSEVLFIQESIEL